MKKIIVLLCVVFFTALFSGGINAERIFFANGDGTRKEIALTFDDGPGLNTKAVLEILKDKEVKATFFLLGESIEKMPHLVKEIYDDGHEIGNHTYNHINFYESEIKSEKDFEDLKEAMSDEIIKTQELIETITDYRTRLVRFPYGYMRPAAIKAARENGYRVINWSFGTDWKPGWSWRDLLNQYYKNAKPGAVFLMHDLSKSTRLIKMLPELIEKLKTKGYDFVTVSELLNFVEKKEKEPRQEYKQEEVKTEPVAEPETQSEIKAEIETVPEAESETESDTELNPEAGIIHELKLASQNETAPESETEPQTTQLYAY